MSTTKYQNSAGMSSTKTNITGSTPAEVPNFTQTPNSFYDRLLPQINSMSELKVTLIIIRQTFGWCDKNGGRKLEDQLSLSRLADLTGMARTSVYEGIVAGMKRGTILRRKKGRQDYMYRLNLAAKTTNKTASETDEPARNRYQYENTTSSESLPVTSSDSGTVLVVIPGTQKKGKEKEIKEEGNAAKATPLPSALPVQNTAEGLTNPSKHPAVLSYQSIHRLFPKKTGKDGEPSEMEMIIAAVGDKPEDLETWEQALKDYREIALLHNANLQTGQKRWNPAGVDSAVRQFSELVTERDFESRQVAAPTATGTTTGNGLTRVEVGGNVFYVQPQGGAR
ncbi:MAG: hypothetical protein MSG64_06515 [Pyrinomonadaceae bacterium MAG19_C2-C3]|nr:hypothetical protein [Pyrinomonadaceae bacterium MAG19_C2-C3]